MEYWVTVEDTQGDQRRTYHNPPKEICGQSDVAAFSGDGLAARLASPAGDPAQPGIDLVRLEAAPLSATGVGRPEEAGGKCESSEELLCLLDNRFSVDVTLTDTVTGSAAGYANKKGSICGHVDTGPF